MSIYEHTYIATPDCNRKDIDNIEKKIESILTSNAGKIVRKEDWGLRNLAYEINKNKKGHYTMMILETNPNSIAEYERNLKLHDKNTTLASYHNLSL